MTSLVLCTIIFVFVIGVVFFSSTSHGTGRTYSKYYKQNSESEDHADMLRSIDNRLRESNEIAKRDLYLRINKIYDKR
jgi:hypothetical protein